MVSEGDEFTVTVSEYGAVGEFIIGTFEGTRFFPLGALDYEGRFKIMNDGAEPIVTNCSISDDAFVGEYAVEAVQGNEFCFGGEIFSTGANISLEYISEFERTAIFEYGQALNLSLIHI